MNEYYSGDVGKCPFATAAHARALANTQTSIAALKQFAKLIVRGLGCLVGAAVALGLVAMVAGVALGLVAMVAGVAQQRYPYKRHQGMRRPSIK